MQTPQNPGSTEGIGELMKKVERLERRWRHLPGRGEEGFPLGGRAVLESLRELGPQTVPQVARRRGTSRQNIQVLVNRLKADGWVEMAMNPAHKRSELVQLTAQGREVVDRMATKEAVFLDGVSARMSAKAIKGALAALQRLEALLAGEPESMAAKARLAVQEEPVLPVPEQQPPAEATAPPQPTEEELPVSLL